VPISKGIAMDIYEIMEYFKDKSAEQVFGQELESVRTIKESRTDRDSMIEGDVQAVPADSIRMQMAQTDKEVRQILSKSYPIYSSRLYS
jgi:hypothetical protein